MLAPHRLAPATMAIKRRPLPTGWISACVALFLMVFGIAPALATNGTWSDTTSGGLWSTTGNWSGGIVANGTDGIADFSTLNITADDTVHLNSARTIGQLKFGDTTPSNNWILDDDNSGNILTLAVSSGSPTITVNNDTATMNLVLGGTQGFTKSGAGELLLNDADTFTGSVAINAGTLALGNASALGGTTNSITVGAGATLNLGGQAIGANPLAILGSGVGGNGALVNSSATAASFAGTVTANGPFTVGGTGDITLSGSVNGGNQALTKIGNNTLTLSGSTDNSGLAVTVNSGTVVLAKTSSGSPNDVHAIGQDMLTINGGTAQLGGTGGDQIYDLGSVTVTSGTFDTNGRNETFATLKLQGTGIGGSGALVNSAAAFSAITPTGGAALTGNATIGVTQSTGELQLNDAIGGNFALTKVGAGTLLLAGNNTFTGGVTVDAGTLALGNAGALGGTSNTDFVNSGGTLDLGGQVIGANALTISGTGVGGNGALVNSSASPASFAGTITASGPFTVGGPGDITLSGSVDAFDQVLTKIGNNTLTLSGTTDNNSLPVTVNSGTVVLAKTSSGSVHAIGQDMLTVNGGTAQLAGTGGDQIYDLGSVSVTSGSFDTNSRNETFATLTLQGPGIGGAGALVNSTAAVSTITPTGGTTLTGNATIGVTQGTGELQLNNAIGGNFALTKTGLGTLDLEGTNTFSGGLTVQQGTLFTSQPINNASTNGALGNNSSVTLGSSGQTGTIEVFASGTTNMPFTLAAGGTGAFSLFLGTNLQLSGAIGGTGALLANGSGTLTLSGNNTFTGGVTIQLGTLRVGSATALGSTTNNVSVSNGATLDLAGQTIGANPLAILGAGVGGNGALINSSVSPASYAGNIIGNNGPATIGGNGQITLSGSVSNSMPPNVFQLTKIGGDTLILSGTTDNFNLEVVLDSGTVILAKTSSGSPNPDVHAIGQPGLIINGGIAQLGGTGGDQIFDLAPVTITSGAFDTNGLSETFASLNLQGTGLGGAGALINSAAAFSVITPTGGTTLTGATTIGVTQSTGELQLNNAIGGNFALTKTGSGTLLLAGNNTLTPSVAINAGTLALGNASALGGTTNSITVGAGATLNLGGQAIGANPLAILGSGVGGNGALVNSSATAASFAGTVTANGPFTVGGTGDITLSGSVNGGNQALTKIGNNTLTLSGSTDNSGLAVTVNSGTVVLAKTSSGSPNDVHAIGQDMLTINGGTAQLGGTGGDQIYDLGSVTVTSGTFDTNGRNETFATLKLQGTGIGGSGALVNSAAAFSAITPTGGAALTGNATIGVTQSTGELQLNDAIGGNFALTKVGAGTLLLAGNNTFTGGVTISGGTLQVGNPGALNSSSPNSVAFSSDSSGTLSLNGNSVTVSGLTTSATVGTPVVQDVNAASAVLTVNNSVANTFAGTLQDGTGGGSLGLTKSGGGTLTLSGNNTFTGGVTIQSGTLRVGSATALGSTTNNVSVSNGATLDLAGQTIGANPLAILGAGVGGNGALINSSVSPASYAGNIIGNNGPATIGGNGQITLSGSVSNSMPPNVFQLTKIGGDTLILSGTTDNFNLEVVLDSGTVILAKTSSGSPNPDVHAIGQPGLIINGGIAQLGGTGGDQIFDLAPVTITSGAFDTNGLSETFASLNLQGTGLGGAGALINSAAAFSVITPTGGTTLTGATTIGVTQSTGELQLNNAIGGNFALTKTGSGTLLLAGNNTFTGSVAINAGTLALGNSGALGSTANNVSVSNGATLDLAGQTIGANPLAILGAGVGGNGALINSSVSPASYAGNIIGNNGPATIGGNGQITLSGSVSNSMPPNVFQLTKIGGDTLILSGTTDNFNLEVVLDSGTVILAKTSSGSPNPDVHAIGQPGLIINGGIAQLGGTGGDQIFDLAPVTITSGAFDTNGLSETFASLNLQGTGLGGAGALINSAAAFSVITPTGGTTLTGATTIGVTQSTGELQLNNAIGGNFALTKTGLGTLDLEGTNTFSGGLIVQDGALQVPVVNNAGTNGPLGNNTSVALGVAGQSGAGQPIGTLEYTGGTASSTMTFTLPASNGAIQIDNASTNLTLTNTIGVSGEFIKAGIGTLTLTANPTLNANSTLLINGGKLQFANSGATTIGAGVTAMVASGATLELAGSASALSAGPNRVNITNNSTAPGVLVTGTNQQVGFIDGSGTTQVNAGSDLTANHIIQSVLVIAGTAGSHGLVTIDASDALGNPLDQASGLALAGSLSSSRSFGADGITSTNLSSGGGIDLASLSPNSSIVGDSSPVPEPSTLLLVLLAVLGVVSTHFVRNNRRSHTV